MVFYAGETLTAQDLNALLAGIAPIGSIMMWPATTPPPGWLICNGTTFSAVTYPTLNTVLGGNTLPNFQNRFPIGSHTSGTPGAAVKGTGGAASFTLTTTELPAHGHAITGASQSHDVIHNHVGITVQKTGTAGANGDNGGNSVQQGATSGRFNASASGSTDNGSSPHTHNPGTYAASNTGSGAAFSILNPYIGMHFIIRAWEIAS